MLADDGEICIDDSWELTAIVLVPVAPPNVAEIVADPAATALTFPAVSTDATLELDELQVALLVMSCVVPSLSVAVATRLTIVFGAISAVAGVTEMEVTVAVLTVSGVEPVTPLKLAEMLVVPEVTAVAVFVPPTVATAVLLESQLESFVMSWMVPSLKWPAAEKSRLVPIAIVCPGGMTLIDTIVAFVTVNGVVPVMPLRAAEIVVPPGEKPFDCPLLWI